MTEAKSAEASGDGVRGSQANTANKLQAKSILTKVAASRSCAHFHHPVNALTVDHDPSNDYVSKLSFKSSSCSRLWWTLSPILPLDRRRLSSSRCLPIVSSSR
jgi:hypothetical protein